MGFPLVLMSPAFGVSRAGAVEGLLRPDTPILPFDAEVEYSIWCFETTWPHLLNRMHLDEVVPTSILAISGT